MKQDKSPLPDTKSATPLPKKNETPVFVKGTAEPTTKK
jgi:hypothetical protein